MSEASRAAKPLAIVSVTVMHAAQRQTNVFSGSFLATAEGLVLTSGSTEIEIYI
jgi:hypothetical protein